MPLPRQAEQLYTTYRPVRLGSAPTTFSFSTLKALSNCPRQWQLLNAEYADLPSPYPLTHAPGRVKGTVVHRFLQELMPQVALAGYPSEDEPEFTEIMREFKPRPMIERLLAEEQSALQANPRAWRDRELGLKVSEVLNTAFRLLRASYEPAPQREGVAQGAASLPPLPEQKVRHPRLPLKGFLDLVVQSPSGDLILDYKSGEFRPEYLDQLKIYALLWWRDRGRLPSRLRVILTTQEPPRIDFEVDEQELVRLEGELELQIQDLQQELSRGMATARPDSERCRWCAVRQLCDGYWQSPETGLLRDQASEPRTDVELVSCRLVSDWTLQGISSASGREVRVLADESFGTNLRFLAGRPKVRLLGVTPQPDGTVVLGRYSEAFVAG